MSTYLITGTSKGLGLEMVKQLEAKSVIGVSRIFAVTRSAPSEALHSIITSSKGRVVSVVANLSDSESLRDAAKTVEQALQGKGLDVVVNNAGAGPITPGGLQSISKEFMTEMLDTNMMTAHLAIVAFLPLLRQGREKKIVNISSSLGSVTYASQTGFIQNPAYKIAKAANNMMTVQYAMELESEGFIVFALNPGWVRTIEQNDGADLEVEEAVKGILGQVMGAENGYNGKFKNIYVEGWADGERRNRYGGEDIMW